jgi:hypothetical protein
VKPNQTGMKIEIVNMFTCLHETGMKITNFLIYSPCQAIFFFRWLLLACVVHLFQCQHSFRSEFMQVWSQSAWSSRRNDLRPHVNI